MEKEMRLIDANALQLEPEPKGYMNGVVILGRSGEAVMHLAQEALRLMIKNAPTIDAVEVVRCKDCVYGIDEEYKGIFTCKAYLCGMVGYNKADDFCSYGERRSADE